MEFQYYADPRTQRLLDLVKFKLSQIDYYKLI